MPESSFTSEPRSGTTRALAAALLLAVTSLSPGCGDNCVRHTDCAGGSQCVLGLCQKPPVADAAPDGGADGGLDSDVDSDARPEADLDPDRDLDGDGESDLEQGFDGDLDGEEAGPFDADTDGD